MPKVIAGSLGNCVHIAGVVNFLALAERAGYDTEFLGAAVPVEDFVEAVRTHDPDLVGVSYRLTPEVAERLLADLKQRLQEAGLADRRFVFAGTPPVCAAAEKLGWFERCFTGLEPPEETWCYLRGEKSSGEPEDFGTTQLARLEKKKPYPLLRHHFGLPSLEDTIAGVRQIADSRVVDVISIGPDQNAQEAFFRPEEMDPTLDGAGGVPIRTREELDRIYQASRTGNYPLVFGSRRYCLALVKKAYYFRRPALQANCGEGGSTGEFSVGSMFKIMLFSRH